MNKQIGDRLAAEYIALIPFYGSCVSLLNVCFFLLPQFSSVLLMVCIWS